MERNRTFIIFLALLWHLTAVLFAEGRSLSEAVVKTDDIYPDNLESKFHSRSLLAPYDIERCSWMQDSSCQINPKYARVFLSHSTAFPNKAVLDTVLDEASCLSTTHKAACTSQKKCNWVEGSFQKTGRTQYHCQHKGAQNLWRRCSTKELRDFVEEYMVCRKSQRDACNPDSNCEIVQTTSDVEGCGLMANRVLDLTIRTPASQTEIIGTLIESTRALQRSSVPDLEAILEHPLLGGDDRRRLLDDDTVDDMLAVNEGPSGASSNMRSAIAGTGNANGVEYEKESRTDAKSDNETIRNEDESSERSTSSDASSASTSLTSTEEEDASNNAVRTVSLSFSVPIDACPDKRRGTGHSADSSDDIREQIIQPLELAGSTRHLREVKFSASVFLDEVASALDTLVSIVEERPGSENNKSLFWNVTSLLEIMRFKLDNAMDQQNRIRTWSGADVVWWKLQQTAQALDLLAPEDETGALNESVRVLIESCEIVRTTWSGFKGSNAFLTVRSVEQRLRNLLQEETSSENDSEPLSSDLKSIRNFEDLISDVALSFNGTLFSLYPQKLNISFTKKYNQVWVEVLARRNKKWHDIKTFVSSRSNMGQAVTNMLKQLYLVKPINASLGRNTNTSYEFQQLKLLTEEIVGALSATSADKYKIENLSSNLTSSGIQIFQKGPQITANDLIAAVAEDREGSTSQNTGMPIESMDDVRNHLEALIVLIDDKIDTSYNSRASELNSRGIPKSIRILNTVETALEIVKSWNDSSTLRTGTEQNFYGNSLVSDFDLSLAGCVVLGPNGNKKCSNLDDIECVPMGLHDWSVSSGIITDSNQQYICVPSNTTQKVTRLLRTPKQVSMKLAQTVADVFFITAYCQTRTRLECGKDEKCALHTRLEDEVCRPSSNVVNHQIEVNEIIKLAANDDSCRSYLGFPICTNFQTQTICNAGSNCLWIGSSLNEGFHQYESTGMCMTNWSQQLFQLNSTALGTNTQFYEDISSCQNQPGEESCGRYGVDETNANSRSETSFPKSSSSVRPWIVSCLTVLVTILFLMVVCISCKIYKSRHSASRVVRSKKGRTRKVKGETAPVPAKLPPFPMYSHVFELSPYDGSPNQKKTASFPYDGTTFENVETGSQCSRLRVPLQQDSRMERYTSATTAEISEIQPISEVEEIEPASESENDESEEEGWSSTNGWSDESDEESVNGSGSSPKDASTSRV